MPLTAGLCDLGLGARRSLVARRPRIERVKPAIEVLVLLLSGRFAGPFRSWRSWLLCLTTLMSIALSVRPHGKTLPAAITGFSFGNFTSTTLCPMRRCASLKL
jgi:hypothetical protein